MFFFLDQSPTSFTVLLTARQRRCAPSYFSETYLPLHLNSVTCFLDSFSISFFFSSLFFLAKYSAECFRNVLWVLNVRRFSACFAVTHLYEECSPDNRTLPPRHS